MAIEAITFDFWNTLVHEPKGDLGRLRVEAWSRLFEGASIEVERAELESAMENRWRAFVTAWQANEHHDSEASIHEAIDGLIKPGREISETLRTELVEAFMFVARDAELELTPHTAEVLADLADRGITLGIVCDVGLTGSPLLREALQGHGVLRHFKGWAFSDEVGVYKPDAKIFRHALAEMGVVDPTRCAHVGDLRRTDVAGSRAMGMTPVRYAGVFDDRPGRDDEGQAGVPPSDGDPDADIVIDDHRKLVEVLDLA